ncbi:hypothetical protein P389DRAFT_74355 [Cystobasidium minutum MCA 4210]|uniref:uncharacterized protein n=1 Tax=Cystobasidium minutum MCA 4210 TaxID=1397322 RepID=UPI0034CD9BBF|eukprot:jgi/Rhomi1/74355/CE74354_580
MSIITLLIIGAGTMLAWRIYRVRRVRFKNIEDCERKYAYLYDKPEEMTYNIANDILKVSHYWDFPWSLALADALALFKTYAIPTISSTLAMTGELSDPTLAARRAEDTSIFVVEFVTQGLDSERGSTMLARMNYLHSRWGKRIKRDDLLFTLSLFIFEPIVFVEKYEWRPMRELEKQAQFIFWAEIGARMGITDIPKTRHELWEWKEEYAASNMVPSETNGKIGELTLDVLVAPLPGSLKGFGRQVSKVFVDQRVLKAFGWKPAQPAFLHWLVPALMRLRAFILRNLAFPRTKRSKFMTTNEVEAVDSKGVTEKRIQRDGFLWEPWYVPAGRSRIGKLGIGVPGDRDRWHSDGWKSETMGPDKLKDKGVDVTLKEGKRIRESGMACPFFRP